jgi:hypothetical protein
MPTPSQKPVPLLRVAGGSEGQALMARSPLPEDLSPCGGSSRGVAGKASLSGTGPCDRSSRAVEGTETFPTAAGASNSPPAPRSIRSAKEHRDGNGAGRADDTLTLT